MTSNQRLKASKPYLQGFMIGLIAAPIIGFSAGWVSTSGARDDAVETARIDTLSGVCAEAAQKSWASQNMDLAALKGYDNRAQREELITATMAGINMPEELVTKVSQSCSRTLA
jgi:hypothetical protein